MAERIFRSRTDRILGGVCGGIAERYDWDPVWVRLITVLLVLVTGVFILLYLAAWVIIPLEPPKGARKGEVKKVKGAGAKSARVKAARVKSVKGNKRVRKSSGKDAPVVVRRSSAGIITLIIVLGIVAVIAILGLVAKSVFCLSGSGELARETRDVKDFTEVELHGSGTLVVSQGDYEVVIETDDNLLHHYKTRVIGDKLEIGLRGLHCFVHSSGFTAYVTMPDVEELTIYGSGEITSTEVLSADQLDVEIAGSGTIDLEVNVSKLETSIKGSGDAYYSGSADEHEVWIAGSGDIFAYGLDTRETSVDIDGSGDAQVSAREELDVDIAGSGDIRYHGEPRVSQSIHGSGDVQATDNK